jgi:hypothetical protein
MPKFRIEVEAIFDTDGLPRSTQGPFAFNIMAVTDAWARCEVAQFVLGMYRGTMQREGMSHFLVMDREYQNPNSFLFPWGTRSPDKVKVLTTEELA